MRLTIFMSTLEPLGVPWAVTETHDPVDPGQLFSMHGNTSQRRYASNQLQETVHRRR
jgi:hypothetical protein